MKQKGVVAAGHKETALTAASVLQEGGNAFDAVVAAHFTACVAEPVLASLGGGGFLLAHRVDGHQCVYDHFVQTPTSRKAARGMEFFPISADFGSTRQEFHIGRGAAATPGTVRGLFAIQRDLCTWSMSELAQPAIALAKRGVEMNGFQAYIFAIVKAIYCYTPETREVYASSKADGDLLAEGETLRQTDLANCLEALAREGEDLFYKGEIAQRIEALCSEGGHLLRADLEAYQVIRRSPLKVEYKSAKLLTNPPPSSGGLLISFALKLLEASRLQHSLCGTPDYLGVLAQVMAVTNKARVDAYFDASEICPSLSLLDKDVLDKYRLSIQGRPSCSRGTTQISIIDKHRNMASLTTSNGEGCGYFVPGTGVMLNNMLGEEDLNPGGFAVWPEDQRMTSMMAPTLAFFANGQRIATGSGGSNRLRTAILQVLLNLVDGNLSLQEAVYKSRIHLENGFLNIEGGFDQSVLDRLTSDYPDHRVWEAKNLFFGGAHTVSFDGVFSGVGDPRRGGYSIVVS